MAALHENPMPSHPLALAFACTARQCVGLLQMPSLNDIDQVLVPPCSPGAESTPLTDMPDDSFLLRSAPSNSNANRNHVTSHGVPTFGMVELKAIITSDVVSLKHHTTVGGIQTNASACDQETEALTRQVNELRERLASQEDRIACLERSQRTETELYKNMIQDLTTKVDGMKVNNDKNTYDDAIENLRQSFINIQWSMECQAARITGVKADAARRIALLQSELAGVQTEFAASKMVVKAPSTSQAANKTRKAQIDASVTHEMEIGMAQGKLCPLPPVGARSSAHGTVCQAMAVASTASGGPPIILPKNSKVEETTAKDLETTEEPLTAAHADTQPSANKIYTMSMKSALPIPAILIPRECQTLAKSSAKENKPCSGSATTLQATKPLQSGAGWSPNVSAKALVAIPKKPRPDVGLLSKVSAMLKSRSSIPLAARKSQHLSFPQHTAIAGGVAFDDVETAANRPPGGSATRTEHQKLKTQTLKCPPIVASRSLSERVLSTLVEKEPPFALPASSSLTTLDTALQAMELDGDDLLAPMPPPNYFYDDLSFSSIIPIPMITRTKQDRDGNYEGLYAPSNHRKVDVKFLRSPLKSTLAENEVSLPVSPSLTALEVALQGESDILALLSGPDCPSVDFSFSAVATIFPETRAHYKRKSICVSPTKTSTVKPSRRL